MHAYQIQGFCFDNFKKRSFHEGIGFKIKFQYNTGIVLLTFSVSEFIKLCGIRIESGILTQISLENRRQFPTVPVLNVKFLIKIISCFLPLIHSLRRCLKNSRLFFSPFSIWKMSELKEGAAGCAVWCLWPRTRSGCPADLRREQEAVQYDACGHGHVQAVQLSAFLTGSTYRTHNSIRKVLRCQLKYRNGNKNLNCGRTND